MKQLLSVILVGALCSLYLFPITFTFLPVGNTKIYMAVLGLLLFVLNRITSREPVADRSMVYVSLAALGISLTSSSVGGYSSSEVYLLAKCIYAEARGEPYAGKVAVGAVILNRVKSIVFAVGFD